MDHRIEVFREMKMVGKKMKMNFAENKTADLWKSFMQERRKIEKVVGSNLYSVQIYPESFFEQFNVENYFEKWAAIQVTDDQQVPEGMEPLTLPEGLYVVFDYKGSSTKAADAFQYIFNDWLPQSDYKLANRPHFEILGEKYKNADPDSEEEIWIPIKAK